MSNAPTVTNKEVLCPFCKRGKVNILIVSDFYTYKVSRISAKSERIPKYHAEKIEIGSKCPECGKSSKEIKEALEHGKSLSHEERIRKLRESGLPTVFESKT